MDGPRFIVTPQTGDEAELEMAAKIGHMLNETALGDDLEEMVLAAMFRMAVYGEPREVACVNAFHVGRAWL